MNRPHMRELILAVIFVLSTLHFLVEISTDLLQFSCGAAHTVNIVDVVRV